MTDGDLRGDVGSLENVLSRSMVTWQGIVKNIEYLSLDDSIKRVMGKWWRTWVKTDVGRRSHHPHPQSQSQSQSGVEGLRPGSAKGTRVRSTGVRLRARARGESSEIESDSEDEQEEHEEDGMQVDDLHPSLGVGMGAGGTTGTGVGVGTGVEGDDGGVSQLLKNL